MVGRPCVLSVHQLRSISVVLFNLVIFYPGGLTKQVAQKTILTYLCIINKNYHCQPGAADFPLKDVIPEKNYMIF